MKKVGDSWDEFLLRNHFEEPKETLSEGKLVRRSRRGKFAKSVEIKIDKSIQEDSEEIIYEKLAKINSKRKR